MAALRCMEHYCKFAMLIKYTCNAPAVGARVATTSAAGLIFTWCSSQLISQAAFNEVGIQRNRRAVSRVLRQRCTVWNELVDMVSMVGRTSEGAAIGAGCAGSSAATEVLLAW